MEIKLELKIYQVNNQIFQIGYQNQNDRQVTKLYVPYLKQNATDN